MSPFEEKLKELNITPETRNHSYDYLYNCYNEVWNFAIEEAAKEAKTALTSTYIVIDKESILKLKV